MANVSPRSGIYPQRVLDSPLVLEELVSIPACNVIRCLRLNVLLYTSAFRVVMVDTFVKSVSSKPPIGKGVEIVSTLLGATEPYSYPRISEI